MYILEPSETGMVFGPCISRPQVSAACLERVFNQHLHSSRVVCSMCTSREVIRLVLQHVGAKICTMVFATFQNCNLHFPSICMAYSSVHLQLNV